jgi:hypothetical protein
VEWAVSGPAQVNTGAVHDDLGSAATGCGLSEALGNRGWVGDVDANAAATIGWRCQARDGLVCGCQVQVSGGHHGAGSGQRRDHGPAYA